MDNTSIKYAEVAQSVAVLRDECLPRMRNIFSDFNESLKIVGNQNVFVGDANETVQSKARQFGAKFKEFEDLVIRFAQMYETASQKTSDTEQRLSQEAENIKP